MNVSTSNLSYFVTGDGLPVLLVHGFAGTARTHFEHLIPELASRYAVIAPDLRGHGGSRHLELACSECYFETHVQDLELLLVHLGITAVHLIGYSDGGEIAIKLAARLGEKALSLCAWGVSGLIPPDQMVAYYAHEEADELNRAQFWRDLEELHGEHARSLVRCWVHAMRCLAEVGGDSSFSEARHVQCKSLLLTGDRDPFNPLHLVRSLAGVMPGSELVVLAGAGHDLIGERREQLLVVVRQFLEQPSGSKIQQNFRDMEQRITEMTPAPHFVVDGVGQTVVLLHGWGASHELFMPVLQLLRHRFRVVSLDFPGFGATPPPPRAWAVHDYAEWVLAMLTQLGIPTAHFVGHSFGGRVAISIASRHPERVEKLVLTASAGIPPQRSLVYHLRVRLFKMGRWLVRRRFVPAPIRNTIQAAVSKAGSVDYQQASGTVKDSFVRVVNEDLRPYLPRIAAPTLLIWGDQDSDTPVVDGQTMEKLIPDAGLIVFEGGGHYAYLEQAGQFCHIIETFFLQP